MGVDTEVGGEAGFQQGLVNGRGANFGTKELAVTPNKSQVTCYTFLAYAWGQHCTMDQASGYIMSGDAASFKNNANA